MMKSNVARMKHFGVAALLAVSAGASQAAAVVTNGGFETGLTGWQTDSSFVVSDTSAVSIGTLGENAALYQGTTDGSSASLWQNIALSSNYVYELTFYVKGGISAFSWSFGDVDLGLIDLSIIDMATQVNPANSDSEWTKYVAEFTGYVGGELRFAFAGMTEIFLDEVSLNGECLSNCDPVNVPEPGSLFLVGLALAGLASVRKHAK